MVDPQPKEKREWGLILGSCAVIGIAGLGGYYLYTRQQLVNKYVYWVQEYWDEYNEYMDNDGHIPVCEGASPTECKCTICGETHDCYWENGQCISPLDWKTEQMEILRKMIEEQNLVHQVIEALKWTFGIVFTWGVYKIIRRLLDEYLKRHPPPNAPPGEPYYNPVDETWHPTGDDLEDYVKRNHPNKGDPELNRDAWETVLTLPAWILDWLTENVPNFAEGLADGWGSLEEWQQIAIIVALLAALLIILALSLGSLWPILGVPITACTAACA